MGGYDQSLTESTIREAWEASIAAGVVLFDTAEVYGDGRERAHHRASPRRRSERTPQVVIASKFMPSPWKINVRAASPSRPPATRASGWASTSSTSTRFTVPSRCVPTTRWPTRWPPPTPRASCAPSAYRTIRPRRPAPSMPPCASAASAWPATRSSSPSCEPCRCVSGSSAPAASSASCPLAYSPIGQGRLTGKYSAANPPPRGRSFSAHPMSQVDAIVAQLRRIGTDHGDRTPSQVALAWLIAQGRRPHPGCQEPGPGRAERGRLGLEPDRRRAGPSRHGRPLRDAGASPSAFGSTAETGGTVLR